MKSKPKKRKYAKRKHTRRERQALIDARWRKFAQLFVLSLDGAQSYREAGYKVRTNNAAAANASRLLIHAKVQEYIQLYRAKATKAAEENFEISKDRVLAELAAIGFANSRNYGSWTGRLVTLKNSADLTRTQAAAIQSIGENANGTIKLKLYDKRAALETIAKIHGWIKAEPELPPADRPVFHVHSPAFRRFKEWLGPKTTS